MPFMTRIPRDLKDFGLSVALVPGWESRGSASFAPACVVAHWTAGPKNAKDKARPSLAVVTNGRPGIPGPLCNVYLGRDGTCVVVAAGRANHAGQGGFRGLVGNSAAYGIEAESGGDNDWTDAQKRAYPRLIAALLHGLGRDASWACGHNEWAPTRKIDIRDWPMSAMRDQVAAILSGSEPAPDPTKEKIDVYAFAIYSAPGEGFAYFGGPGVWKRIDGGQQWVDTAVANNPGLEWRQLQDANHLEWQKNFLLFDCTGKNNVAS
jgi:N-acetylmuramoyl-L-alanine amidase